MAKSIRDIKIGMEIKEKKTHTQNKKLRIIIMYNGLLYTEHQFVCDVQIGRDRQDSSDRLKNAIRITRTLKAVASVRVTDKKSARTVRESQHRRLQMALATNLLKSDSSLIFSSGSCLTTTPGSSFMVLVATSC